MKHFFEEWSPYFKDNSLQISISSSLTNQLQEADNQQNIIVHQFGAQLEKGSEKLSTKLVDN